MKKLFIYLFLSLTAAGYSQGSMEKLKLPDVIPPSPTVAALMKFEEVPVETYTGVPNISFPFYNLPLDKELSMDVSLSYHPSGVRLEETAGWAGNGWSLMAGGSISRTVYGKPDETETYGIYATSFLTTQIPSNAIKWETAVLGRYDTESDLYQFNFMGHSGRFFIRNAGSIGTTALEVVYLKGDNTYKVIPYFSTNNLIERFVIIDNKGYTYNFATYETSTSTSQTNSTSFAGTINQALPTATSSRSAWQLTGVTSPFGKVLCTLTYDDANEQVISPRTMSKHIQLINESILWDQCSGAPPRYSVTYNEIFTNTRKLNGIQIPGQGNIVVESQSGRLDLPSGTGYDGRRLSGLTLLGADGGTLKRYALSHTYEGAGQRLVLNRISEYPNDGGIFPLITTFAYDNIAGLPDKNSYSKDYWGYYNGATNTDLFPSIPEIADVTGAARTASPSNVIRGLLKSITYPNGGVREFEFESNRFCYVGKTPAVIEPTSTNTEEKSIYLKMLSSQLSSTTVIDITFTQTPLVRFAIDPTNTGPANTFKSYFVRFQPVVLNDPQNANSGTYVDPAETRLTHTFSLANCPENIGTTNECMRNVSMQGRYRVILVNDPQQTLPMGTVTYSVNVNYSGIISGSENVTGGGVRIRSIRSKDYGQVMRETNYNYNLFDTPGKSSGSVTYLPKFYYLTHKGFYQGNIGYDKQFYVVQDFGLNNIQKTQGGDVGYKNVTVSETGNGKTTFIYTSPFDVPEPDYLGSFPFLQSNNWDFKRGLLLQKSVYNESGAAVKEQVNTYTITSQDIYTGAKINFRVNFSCPFNGMYASYVSYQNGTHTCSDTFANLAMIGEYQTCGWAQLTGTINREYFYTPTQYITASNTTNTYNSTNKQISTTTTVDNCDYTGATIITSSSYNTRYYYPDEISSASSLPGGNLTAAEYSAISLLKDAGQHRDSEPIQIEKTKNTLLVSRERHLYSNAWTLSTNCHINKIQQAKDTQPLATMLVYKEYDNVGNLLEVQMENGSPVTYLWGYGKAQPIAKIENATFLQTAGKLGLTPVQLSNYTESNMPAIDGLRSSFATQMITTMTFQPFVGVLQTRDPKGLTFTYSYDNFNRLVMVKDGLGNILEQNSYNYRQLR